MKNILTGNLWPNMGQVILLYCHTMRRKKALLSVLFYSNSENFITRSVPSQMLRRIVNTSQQRHYSCVLIYAFCGGVVKDHEAPFSLNYIRPKNYLKLRSYVITRCLLPPSVVELIFSCNTLTRLKILRKLNTQPKYSRFVYLNAITFKNFKTSKM